MAPVQRAIDVRRDRDVSSRLRFGVMTTRRILRAVTLLAATAAATATAQNGMVVLQTDFGLKDGAISAMKGVAMQVSPGLKLFDLTHEIPPFNIWEAGYRLHQTAQYWPRGTVFVSVVDPGVGSARKSVVIKTQRGQFFVGPDNGQFTLIAEYHGIDAVREIDETRNRLTGSAESYTFHGRDVYAYTAARLAAGVIRYADVGPLRDARVVTIDYQKPAYHEGVVSGNIPILDVQYGNVWTNIDKTTFGKLNMHYGDSLHVIVSHAASRIYEADVPFVTTFADVPEGKPLAYFNSLLNLAIGLNFESFAKTYLVSSGPDWNIEVRKK